MDQGAGSLLFWRQRFRGRRRLLCGWSHSRNSDGCTGVGRDRVPASRRSFMRNAGLPIWEHRATRRRVERDGMVGVPPSLPLLALTVLAASLMQREGDVASHNFYRRFREQLDPLDDQPGIPGDFGDWIPSLWRQLERWLNEHLGGASGVVVLQSQEALDHNPYGKNIAAPQSTSRFPGIRSPAPLSLLPSNRCRSRRRRCRTHGASAGPGDMGSTTPTCCRSARSVGD